jgi:sterol desaturase/sphingolipid hydroxylase (fatty acid hydroxylase superfamily)
LESSTLSVVLIITAAVALILGERARPYERRQRFFRPGLLTDLLGYTLAQSHVLSLVIGAIILALQARLSFLQEGPVSAWPPWLQLLVFFVVHDFYIYWFHRWQHISDTLWRIHEAHHSVKDVDWLSGARSHSLEILINQTIEFAPMVLLGASPEVITAKLVLDAVWGMYIHSNLDVHTGKLQYVLNGPEMHRWHHARDVAPPGVNFGTKLAIWDWMFGTAYLPKTKPEAYGLPEADGYPQEGWAAYFTQHVRAFRRRQPSGQESHSVAHADAVGDTAPPAATS